MISIADPEFATRTADINDTIAPRFSLRYTLLFTANSRESFIARSRRTKHSRDVNGSYVFVCPGIPSISGENYTIVYIGEGNLRGRIRRYRYHLEKGDASKHPHRDVHRGLAAVLATGQIVEVYVRTSTKSEAQAEEKRILREYRPCWNK